MTREEYDPDDDRWDPLIEHGYFGQPVRYNSVTGEVYREVDKVWKVVAKLKNLEMRE